MGLGGARCRAGAGGVRHRGKFESPGLRDALEPWQNIARRAHVTRFFLHPHNLPRVGMLLNSSGNLRAWQRVELVEKENGGAGVLAAAAFGAKLVANFSRSE